MKIKIFCILFLISLSSAGQKKSCGFIENKGQIVDEAGKNNNAVLYLLNTRGLNVQLRKNGFSYDIYEPVVPVNSNNRENNIEQQFHFHRIDIDFIGANPAAFIKAEGQSEDYDHYYTNQSKADGITFVHSYSKVTYHNIYRGIDAVFFIPENPSKPVEYNFIIHPQGNISDIKLSFKGARTELVDNKISVETRFGIMEEVLPMSWVEDDDRRQLTTVQYKKIKKGIYGFSSEVPAHKKLVIDPVPIRLWGTYYGGAGSDYPLDVVTSPGNSVYMAGKTSSTNNIATTGTYPEPYFLYNGFIVKFDSEGNRLWGIYYTTIPASVNVDTDSNVYFTGAAASTTNNVTTLGSHQPVSIGYYDNAYLVKLNDSGVREWGTFFGGQSTTKGKSISFDNENNVYLAGSTDSHDHISTPSTHQTEHGNGYLDSDGFVARFTSQGVQTWGTYYGGSGSDEITSINFSQEDGHIYIAGNTRSTTAIATPQGYQPSMTGFASGFIAKLTLDGQRIWGTYFGGSQYTGITNAKMTGSYLYFIGVTDNTNLNSTGTFNPVFQDIDMNYGKSSYVAKFDVATSSQLWGTYFKDYIQDLDVSPNDFVYFTGSTDEDQGIATPGSFLEQNTYGEAYLIKLDGQGQRVWGTYYGGNLQENFYGEGNYCNHVALDANNNIYIVGDTWGSTTGIATPGAHQTTLGDNYRDAFLAKFQDCETLVTAGSNSPVCIGNDIEFTASGGTNYVWSGPNGYTSSLQNPVIANAGSLNNGEYTCSITGTGSCDSTIKVQVTVGDTVAPVPNVAILPVISGNCDALVIPFPQATDNCQGSITATTNSPLVYTVSGSYSITWDYTDSNGNVSHQEQTVEVSPQPLPVVASTAQFCYAPDLTLEDITITGENILWYDSPAEGANLNVTTPLVSGTTYYASQTIGSCQSQRAAVTVTVQSTPAPSGEEQQRFCQNFNATLSDFDIDGVDIKFYDQEHYGNALPSNTNLVNGVPYWASQTVNGCESPQRHMLVATILADLPASDYDTKVCDDRNDGIEVVDLSTYNSNLISGSANYNFAYYTTLQGAEEQNSASLISDYSQFSLGNSDNLVYVRIEMDNLCYKVVQLSLELILSPQITLKDSYSICEDDNLPLSADAGYTYKWSTGSAAQSIIITQPGNYWLTLSKDNSGIVCSSTKHFVVENSYTPSIKDIVIRDWTDDSNIISIITEDSGDYEYSVDGINYQRANTFEGLAPGKYTVYVRDANRCGTDYAEVLLLMYPKFFTPNGDGINDFWSIKFSSWEPGMHIVIMDRYGKLLKSLSYNDKGWDGKYNGEPLPSTDYWFIATRADGTQHKGHFTLER